MNNRFDELTKGLAQSVTRRAALKKFRSEEHTSELQSRLNLVCRLLLEKKQLVQPGDDFLLARNDDVISFEIVVYVDAQSAFGQIFDVAERRLDRVALSQIFLHCLRLGL